MLDLNPEYDSAWRNLCLVYNKKGLNFDFQNLKPNSDVAWYFLAKELLFSGYFKDALDACERSLNINPSFKGVFKIRERTINEIKKQNMESFKPKRISKKPEVDPLLERFKNVQEKARSRRMEVDEVTSKEIPIRKHVKIKPKVENNVKKSIKAKPIFISDITQDILNSYFVVDGANVGFGSQKSAEIAQLSNIEKLRNKLEEDGIKKYIIICDKSLYHKIDDPHNYNKLIENGEIIETPAGTEADYFILQYALSKNAYIISNDRFRDFYNAFGESWIKKKRITFTFIDQEIYLDKLMKIKALKS